MMTLDEAIQRERHAMRQTAGERSEEHRQLAEWLKELKQWKTLVEGIDLRPESLMKPFQPNVSDLESENDRLKAENKKLRSERDHWHVEQVHAYGNWEDTHKYAAKLKAENAELRYKVHVLEGGNKSLKILYDSLKANNAKLRKLCADMLAQLLNAYDPKELTEFFDRMHGVGIEVPHECE